MGHVVGSGRPTLLDTGAPEDRTLINEIDPRTRILAAIAFAVVVVSLHDLRILTGALLFGLALMLMARLPTRSTLRRMVTMDSFIVFMLLLLPFTVPGDEMFTVFGFPATWQGLRQAVEIGLKANAIILTLMALVGSVEPVRLGHALYRLKMPEALVYLLMFMVRYVDVLQQEYLRLRVAMKARGFRPGNNRHTYQSLGYLIGMMLVRAVERSERILGAMKCRGFSGGIPLLGDLAYTGSDVYFALGFGGVLAALLALQFLV
ncbi:cobalt ABC transporter permease [Methyloceanibacter methanicus]|uniref:Cobalt ABC transporter permease n=1 Tax=Methyloceanibacter methanicus TaxID=1774968 RepID=A0A1E3VWK4_9HYPH|nr:cobalt ECF transporter T component CbiQ [Methyloceanibacter methanicus]ODR97902.1 cobalt ABC transporter permease [Methyloceanibacter methanicus]